jgi:GTPase
MPPRRHLPGRLPRRAARTVADTPPCVGFRCGYAAIIGRPNVGKSTLLNRLVGQKVSITSRKAQTTRHRVTGIVTMPDAQVVFVDTPGFQTKHRSRLNDRMNRAVTQCLADVDATVLVLEAGRTTDADRAVIRLLPEGATVVVALNKIDRQKDRDALLPQMAELAALFPFSAIVPVSAEKERALDVLLGEVRALLPEGAPIFGADEITDRDERFLAAEFVREKIFRLLGEEVPYATTVTVDRFEHEGALRRIHATIYVDRESQRAILLGAGGERMKEIASTARVEMERLFGGKVFLEIWVRVKGGWADDEALLTRFGY